MKDFHAENLLIFLQAYSAWSHVIKDVQSGMLQPLINNERGYFIM